MRGVLKPIRRKPKQPRKKGSDKSRLDRLLTESADIVRKTKDSDMIDLLGDGILDEFLQAIAVPRKSSNKPIYDYFLENKHRLQILALIRMAIHSSYPVKGKVKETDIYMSPSHLQWFHDGVMFFQGGRQFEGLYGLYENGKIKFGIAKRDIKMGEKFGPEALEFVDSEELEKRLQQQSVPASVDELERAILELQVLLQKNENDEQVYQKFLSQHPWIFGAQYKSIGPHSVLDDKNIPDFTGVRVRDSARDVIEVKPPFMPIFKGSTRSFRPVRISQCMGPGRKVSGFYASRSRLPVSTKRSHF